MEKEYQFTVVVKAQLNDIKDFLDEGYEPELIKEHIDRILNHIENGDFGVNKGE